MNKKLIAMLFFMAPIALFAQKFGHLNSADIIQVMPEYKTAQTELQNLEKQYSNELQMMESELAKMCSRTTLSRTPWACPYIPNIEQSRHSTNPPVTALMIRLDFVISKNRPFVLVKRVWAVLSGFIQTIPPQGRTRTA